MSEKKRTQNQKSEPGWRRKRGAIPGKRKWYFSPPKRSQRLLNSLASHPICCGLLCRGVKRLERETPPLSGAEAKNEQGDTPTS